mmetsp:Transcript_23621/g.62279  ORF Transcript_23621/g.62279 Transcript_23621/m.62279 type:complete len:138 (+) Transcript_23621:845-1258(+)
MSLSIVSFGPRDMLQQQHADARPQAAPPRPALPERLLDSKLLAELLADISLEPLRPPEFRCTSPACLNVPLFLWESRLRRPFSGFPLEADEKEPRLSSELSESLCGCAAPIGATTGRGAASAISTAEVGLACVRAGP